MYLVLAAFTKPAPGSKGFTYQRKLVVPIALQARSLVASATTASSRLVQLVACRKTTAASPEQRKEPQIDTSLSGRFALL